MEERKPKARKEISRRQFLIETGVAAGGAALGATLLAGCAGATTETVTSTVTKNATVTGPGTTVTATVTGAATTKTATVASTVTSPPVTVTASASAAPISLSVYEPTGAGASLITHLFAKRLTTLANATIAYMAWDASKWQTFRILPYIAALLQKKEPTVKAIPMTEFTQGTGVDSAPDAQKALDKGATAMIDAFAAWGIWAAACGGAAARMEALGVPTCIIQRPELVGSATSAWTAKGLPPELPAVLFSYDLAMVGSDLSVIDPKIDDIIGCIVSGTPKSWKPTGSYTLNQNMSPIPSTYTVTGADYETAYNNLQTLYYSKYLGDGWPITPATKTRCDWLLTGVDYKPTDVVGANVGKDGQIETGNRVLTFQMLAIQMAMAGGRPEYMTMAEASMQNGMNPRAATESSPNFESSSGASPMHIFNGAMADDIRLNNGFGLVAANVKWPAGQLIARACWLVRQSLGNMLSGIGTIGVFGMTRPGWAWAENEAGLPKAGTFSAPGTGPGTTWTTFAQEYYGRKAGDNCVTSGQCFGMGFESLTVRGTYTDPVLKSIQDPIDQAGCQFRNLSTGVLSADSKGSVRLLCIPGQILRFQDAYGWDRKKLTQNYADGQWQVLADTADLSITQNAYKAAGKDITTQNMTQKYKLCTDPTNMRIICCGGDHLVAEFINGWQSFGNTMILKPKSWDTLLAQALKDLGPMPAYGANHNDL